MTGSAPQPSGRRDSQKHVSRDQIAQAEKVIELIYEGSLLRAALEQVGMTRERFAAALSSERALAQNYARAREVGADYLVDEALHVVMTEENQIKARNVADMYRWAAGKFNAKRYGDRIDLNVSQTLDVRAVLVDAQARRMRTISDQHDTLELQVIDNTALPAPEPADTQSVAPVVPPIFSEKSGPADDELDIFS